MFELASRENFELPATVTGWRVRRLEPAGAPELASGPVAVETIRGTGRHAARSAARPRELASARSTTRRCRCAGRAALALDIVPAPQRGQP